MSDAEQKDPRAEDILKRRAEKLAQGVTSAAHQRVLYRVALVALGEEKLGLPVESLDQIVVCPPVARLPKVPAQIAGLVQYGGELMVVLDLRGLLGLRPGENGRYLAVLGSAAGRIGLLVDEVTGFKDISEAEVSQHFEAGAGGRGLPILGTTKDLVTILDGARLIEMPVLETSAAEALGGADRASRTTGLKRVDRSSQA